MSPIWKHIDQKDILAVWWIGVAFIVNDSNDMRGCIRIGFLIGWYYIVLLSQSFDFTMFDSIVAEFSQVLISQWSFGSTRCKPCRLLKPCPRKMIWHKKCPKEFPGSLIPTSLVKRLQKSWCRKVWRTSWRMIEGWKKNALGNTKRQTEPGESGGRRAKKKWWRNGLSFFKHQGAASDAAVWLRVGKNSWLRVILHMWVFIVLPLVFWECFINSKSCTSLLWSRHQSRYLISFAIGVVMIEMCLYTSWNVLIKITYARTYWSLRAFETIQSTRICDHFCIDCLKLDNEPLTLVSFVWLLPSRNV